jgi:UDPglucose 6-dehydrogenase
MNQMSLFNLEKIGIIGNGFVGSTIAKFYDNICVIDIDPDKSSFGATWEELKTASAIFVCVPSPSNHDGSCNSDILKSVLQNLKDYSGVIISKTTVTPDVYKELGKEYPNLVHVPEFLRANHAVDDYLSQSWAIIGGTIPAYQREAERILKISKSNIVVNYCSIQEAALVKYAINTFLATKVVFMNELFRLAEAADCKWDIVMSLLSLDDRIGRSHLSVPGPDDQFGFGGMCFPKDTAALIKYADHLKVDLNILKTAVKKNSLLRLQKPK